MVTQIVVVSNADMVDENGLEQELLGSLVCEAVIGPGPWVQTSFNSRDGVYYQPDTNGHGHTQEADQSKLLRHRYASIGGYYLPEADAFTTSKPFSSWVLNDTFDWVAPKPYPSDGKNYGWDEEKKNWVEIVPPAEA